MDFDLNILRAAVTVVSFAVFLGIVAWAWSKRRANDFDEAANLPFAEHDDQDAASSTPHPR